MNNFLEEVIIEYADDHAACIRAKNSKQLFDLTRQEVDTLFYIYSVPLYTVNFKADYNRKVYMEIVVEWDEQKLIERLDELELDN